MTRRKSKKLRRQFREGNESTEDGPKLETSIEEDLRQQRIRRKERQKEELFKLPRNNGDDTENSIPFEKPPLKRQDLISRGLATSCLEDLVSLPALSFGFVRNESPLFTPLQNHNLGNIWHSKYLLENVRINPMASQLYSQKIKWRSQALPDGSFSTSDMTCKYHLHPSARTFDVATSDETSDPPMIATAVQGGFGIFSAFPRFHTLRGLPVYSIRMHEKSGRCGTIVRPNDRHSLYKFQCYPLPGAAAYFDAVLHEPVTDFSFGTDLVLFACPRYFERTTLSPTFLTLEDGREGSLRILNVQNFPQSDALRVEMSCDQEKFVAFGHRNGQTSLLDLRQSNTTCSILQHMGGSSEPLGSATDLSFLPNKQLVVKRSFGSCQLHDLRRITSSRHTLNTKHTASVVHHMVVPPGEISSTASATCNGLAVDPTVQQTLMAPYIDSNYNACLGIWSLGTGIFVGHKLLAANAQQGSIHVELCQKTTASFSHTKKKNQSPSAHSNERKNDRSRFGVWLKCGRFSKVRPNTKAGSLYHLSFPGSCN